MSGAWVDVDDRLPPFGELVKVWGDYTPGGLPAPKAHRRAYPNCPGGQGDWFWQSDEWRGSNGVCWWWDEGRPTDTADLSAAAAAQPAPRTAGTAP